MTSCFGIENFSKLCSYGGCEVLVFGGQESLLPQLVRGGGEGGGAGADPGGGPGGPGPPLPYTHTTHTNM